MDYFSSNITNLFEVNELNENKISVTQRNDSAIKELKRCVQQKEDPNFEMPELKTYKPVWRKLVVENDVLMKKTETGMVVVVPEAKVSDILYHIHGSPMASHYGVSKCYYKLLSRYYFPKMAVRVAEYIESCELCIKRKMPKRNPQPQATPLSFDAQEIGGCISYDFKGPLPLSTKSALYQSKNRYVLCIIDHATRYVMAVPTPTMEAAVVAEIIISSWIPRFGCPRVVISDRAKNFTGKVMRTIYQALQVDVNLTASYNPSANGLIEQVNRNISSLLMIALEETVEEWPKHLNLLFSAYNASPQTTTHYSPNFLVYGRELVEPLDLCLRMDAIKGRKQRQIVEELEQRLKIRRHWNCSTYVMRRLEKRIGERGGT